MHVAWASNAGYFRHGATMFASLLAVNRDVTATVLCMPDVPESDRIALEQWAASRGARLKCLVPDDILPADLPGIPRLTRATWYRLMLPDLMPELERVIYLDVDVIVRDSLDEVWSLDLGEHWFAAVTDVPVTVGGVVPYRRIGLSDASQYFNAGVLLIDLERFRRERVAERVLRFTAENPDLLTLADQDALNAILHTHRYVLPLRWNVTAPIYEGGIKEKLPFSDQELEDALKRPAVIHYSGIWKPWHYRNKHPLQRLYLEYRKQTPWPDWDYEGQTMKHRILRLFSESTAWRIAAIYNDSRRFVASTARRLLGKSS